VSDANTKTTIAARIPRELARSVAELAQRGNRTVSREVWAAVAEHVANQDPGGSRLLSPPENRAQHVARVPEEIKPAVEARRQRAGQEGT
jgi:hypothetical protein